MDRHVPLEVIERSFKRVKMAGVVIELVEAFFFKILYQKKKKKIRLWSINLHHEFNEKTKAEQQIKNR